MEPMLYILLLQIQEEFKLVNLYLQEIALLVIIDQVLLTLIALIRINQQFQITCTIGQNRYIDKYYFNKGTGDNCVKKCRGPGKNYPSGAGSTTGQNDYSNNFYSENASINLACHNNYGNKVGGSHKAKDVSYKCGKPSTILGVTSYTNIGFTSIPQMGQVDYNIDRSATEPYIICQNDGS